MEDQNDITLSQNEDQAIDVVKIVKYWTEMSDNDFETMIDLYSMKRFNWALFLGHLVIEKLIKAVFVLKNRKHPPFIHDLLKLITKCNIQITEEQMDMLDTITTFNINARYDDYKSAFHKKCTPEYSQIWINNIKTLRVWIKEMLLKS